MYVAVPGPVAEAIARCGGAATPEAASPSPLKRSQGCPERASPNRKGLDTHTKGGDAPTGRGEGIEGAFHEVLRCYPYTRDRAEALALYRPLYEEGVRAPDIARSLRDWEGLHPAREGKGRFYPELASFLDPNNPEGYRALAARARAAAARERAKRGRVRPVRARRARREGVRALPGPPPLGGPPGRALGPLVRVHVPQAGRRRPGALARGPGRRQKVAPTGTAGRRRKGEIGHG